MEDIVKILHRGRLATYFGSRAETSRFFQSHCSRSVGREARSLSYSFLVFLKKSVRYFFLYAKLVGDQGLRKQHPINWNSKFGTFLSPKDILIRQSNQRESQTNHRIIFKSDWFFLWLNKEKKLNIWLWDINKRRTGNKLRICDHIPCTATTWFKEYRVSVSPTVSQQAITISQDFTN